MYVHGSVIGPSRTLQDPFACTNCHYRGVAATCPSQPRVPLMSWGTALVRSWPPGPPRGMSVRRKKVLVHDKVYTSIRQVGLDIVPVSRVSSLLNLAWTATGKLLASTRSACTGRCRDQQGICLLAAQLMYMMPPLTQPYQQGILWSPIPA